MKHHRQKTVTFGVATLDDVKKRTSAAFRGVKQGSHIDFASRALLMSMLTDKRWEIIEAMRGAGPLSIREVARWVDRDVKAVHGDVTALIKCGVVRRVDSGRVLFPYDKVHVDFTLGV